MPPAVSILMPVHQAALTLERAMQSIVAQTTPHWELVAIDDGSSDGSRAILEAWAGRDPRIHLIGPGRVGLVRALNLGLAACSAEWVARMDADDEMTPHRLESQLAFARAHPELGLVSGLVRFGGDPIRAAGFARHVDWLNSCVSEEQLQLNRFVESPLAHPSVLFRRELALLHGAYREGDFPEDYELWLRWWEAGVRMAKTSTEVLVWHDPPGRLTRNDPRYDAERFYAVKAPYVAAEVNRRRAGRPVWLWGAGRPTRRRARGIEQAGVAVAGFIDIDPRKIGRVLHGRPVVGPGALPPPEDAYVLTLVASLGARELSASALQARGYQLGRDYLPCA